MLIVFSGLPGTGKTTLARMLARRVGAVYVRIDSVEHALRGSDRFGEIWDEGYRVGYAVAEDNLRNGLDVVADSVNPIELTRAAWLQVAVIAMVEAVEIEVVCSDSEEHRGRVERRESDIPGFTLPTWNEVVSREYDVWDREHWVIDTAGQAPEESVRVILHWLRDRGHIVVST